MNEAAVLVRPGEQAATTDVGLDVRSIAKSYDRRAVLHDVSLAVHRGEVVGLLGPNGAGKTTCFYSVMGLVKPDSGRIFLDGEEITDLPMYRRAILGLGYLPQETSIFRGLTVEQNILSVLEVSEPEGQVRRERLERLLDEFGLAALRDSPAMALSGGERRRCEIARALAADPSIMLLDEPTFASSSASSSSATSASSSPTTMSAKRWTSWTAPASSTTGRCSSRARPRRWLQTAKSGACTLARVSPCRSA